ncbi:copper amine oxidase N-terminal domain-containing protein [Paenibacillus zanthoxyli]|uniref:copper amine oxidase N-terminal domain-containing protein n=1 Tax=Paenibacillus zanthoxyli TaxID=369399 RepID=UPI00046EE3E0|nr:copper amine oxidase N-terminal domain-containing protein [Paenibacillus zanthoxyli]
MRKFVKSFLGLSLSTIIMFSGTTLAASSRIEIVVNDSPVTTDIAPYLKQGTTIVPLNVVQQIPGINVKWDNASKTVTITRNGETITLVAGEKTATIGSQKVSLAVSSTLEKGRVMVPLRFIAESADAHVIWNAKIRTVYVAKASEELTAKLASTNLAEARSAAVQFPRTSQLKKMDVQNASQNQDYFFPEGLSTSFFIAGGNGVSYYKVTGNHSEEVWSAKLDTASKSSSSLFFLPYKVVDQDGEKPSINKRVVFYHLMLPIMEATYGFVETNGEATTIGQKGMQLNQFFVIEQEK